MNNVVSINSKKFLGSYLYSQNRKSDFEETFLFIGTIMSLVLPQIICLAYAGVIPFIVFAGCAGIGSIIGAIMYCNRNSGVAFRIGAGDVSKAPPGNAAKLKKAA